MSVWMTVIIDCNNDCFGYSLIMIVLFLITFLLTMLINQTTYLLIVYYLIVCYCYNDLM